MEEDLRLLKKDQVLMHVRCGVKWNWKVDWIPLMAFLVAQC